jgi:hypothetical protein
VSGCVRSCLISLMFKKVYKLTPFTASREGLGKVTNMISNDFNLIEIKAPFFFGMITLPLAYIGFIVVIYLRIGAEGLIFMGIPLVLIPIQILLGRVNGKTLEKVNVQKDKRIKVTS